MIDKTKCIRKFIAWSDLGKTCFLEELADGQLLYGSENRALCTKGRLAELFLIYLR